MARVRICCGDHMILARERSVGPEAGRGEIDSKMGRRVFFLCECFTDSGHRFKFGKES